MTRETAVASTVPEPFGKPSGPGLWHVKGMELPAYVQHVAHDLLEGGHAKTESQAIAMAKGIIAKWAKGIVPGHPKYHVHPDVRAAAVKAVAQWEAKRARAHAQRRSHDHSGGTFVGEVNLARRPRKTPESAMQYTDQQELAAHDAQVRSRSGDAAVGRELATHRTAKYGGAAAIRKRLVAHLQSVHKLTGNYQHLHLAALHARHSSSHASGSFSHSHHTSIKPRRNADLSNERLRYDAWGNVIELAGVQTTTDLAMYAEDEGAQPISEWDVERAEGQLGPDHPHTKRLRARLQRRDAAKGALRDKYAEHMSRMHHRGDHKSMALEEMRSEHAREHMKHHNMRHGHSEDMSPVGVGVPLRDQYEPAVVGMSNETVQHFDVWGKVVDLAPPHRTTPTFHVHTPKPKHLATKSGLVAHLRNVHGLSGSHEQKSMQSLQGAHKRDHATRPNLTHRHAPGMHPFRGASLSNTVELAGKKGDPVASMDEAGIKKAWSKLKKLPPGLREHMAKRLQARAKELGIDLGMGSSDVNCSVELAKDTKSKKKGQYLGFEKLVQRLMAQGKSEEEARAIAANIGRAKYGAKKFQSMAAHGQRGG